jgi:hypothetical protein
MHMSPAALRDLLVLRKAITRMKNANSTCSMDSERHKNIKSTQMISCSPGNDNSL